MASSGSPAPALSATDEVSLRDVATLTTRNCAWVPDKKSAWPRKQFASAGKRFNNLERRLYALKAQEPTPDLRALYENLRLIRTHIRDLNEASKSVARLPAVRIASDEAIPRCVVLSTALLDACHNEIAEQTLIEFIDAVQTVEPLRIAELWGMPAALKLVLFITVVEVGEKALVAWEQHKAAAPSLGIPELLRSFRFLGEVDWKQLLEPLSVVHQELLLDPSGVYPRMDFDSRELYRQAIERLAARSDLREVEVARRANKNAARQSPAESIQEAVRDRLTHVGYYLINETGRLDFLREIGYRPAPSQLVQRILRKYPDEFYIIGIEALSLITVVALIMSVVRTNGGWGLIFGAFLLLLPATQAAVEVVNYLVTTILSPSILPKLDFSSAVDDRCGTIVAVPTLLINEKQIRQLVNDLHVRYLVNRDPNIFYALLTDLPDSAEPAQEHDERIELAHQLINELNAQYANEPFGGFYLFHRHRVYNPREGSWMGWERKRGKLLDLNQLLRGVNDPFPVKAGDMSRLPRIRYVLTLDSDTELPRGTAQRLIGAMAHPLNRPLIDPELNIVTEGYGILQPRVGISVHSSTRSRLASIYSGQTGFDIYSRAVSDVYQDLYGEGIFTGKGIYDIDALRQVLEHRFPRNALLSHDLIEGAYARAGLVSDIEVIDDYPSHYSAYNRRRHRWLRGDWQIVRWIFNRVPDESRHLVRNPISLISRWKIIDNLRRSLIEPATFLLLICGWFLLPGGPAYWTLVTLSLLFLPIYLRLLFSLARAAWNVNKLAVRESFSDWVQGHVSISLNIAFLAHQTLVSLDAIIRTVVRSTITHSRLLEWETATEAELGIRKRTPVDIYLDWVPLLAVTLALAAFFRPAAIPYVWPFAIVWGFSKLISMWLNRSPHVQDFVWSRRDRELLKEVCLRTWRYFSEFSNEANHWLIPDNVQEEQDGSHRRAEKSSPTNLGLLLNSRQAALQFGYIPLSDFIILTQRTLVSMQSLPRHHGHFLNWYDNITLKPLEPQFVSSVDSGNLVASLWSLKQHCIELIRNLEADDPNAHELECQLREIADACDRLVREMDFGKLVDQRRKLLSVGYDVKAQKLATSCYDLLASEARIGTFVAVAKGEAPQESWFRLGRQHTVCEGETVLISWTGTMFEYLMPVIWMRSYPNTLLDRTVSAAVRAQRFYASARRVPWGISEAAHSKTDELGNYQYAAFGVPCLALNVARAGSLIVSPYSTALALMVSPSSAVRNLRRMRRAGWLSTYGYYESADYTPYTSRTLLPRRYTLVRCWMAHHQGMALAALTNLFFDSAFQCWFHAEPVVKANELILHERPSRAAPFVDDQPKRVLNFAARPH